MEREPTYRTNIWLIILKGRIGEKVEYSKLWYSFTPSYCLLSFVLKSESRISFFLRYIILRMHFLTLIYNSALIPITNRIPVNLHLLKVRGKLGKKLSSPKSGGRRTRKRRSRTTIKRHFFPHFFSFILTASYLHIKDQIFCFDLYSYCLVMIYKYLMDQKIFSFLR